MFVENLIPYSLFRGNFEIWISPHTDDTLSVVLRVFTLLEGDLYPNNDSLCQNIIVHENEPPFMLQALASDGLHREPGIGDSDVSLTVVPTAVFDKILMSSTLRKDNIKLYAEPVTAEVSYSISKENDAGQTTVYIRHGRFYNFVSYTPEFTSGIKDKYQNCYQPSAGPSCTPDPGGGSPYCCNGALSAFSCEP